MGRPATPLRHIILILSLYSYSLMLHAYRKSNKYKFHSLLIRVKTYDIPNPRQGPGWLNELCSWITKQLVHAYRHTAWVHTQLCKLKKRCTRLAAASDKVYQLLAHGRWFSQGTPTSSTTKTGRHDIAEILLKVALNTKNQSIKKSTPRQAGCS